MKYGILAAGEGSRMVKEGIMVPKPLVVLNGEAMIDRLIRIFSENDAEQIAIITNNLTPLTQQHIRDLQQHDARIKLIVKTTPSSMHSFYELHSLLGSGRFCLTTVDTVFREDEFKQYIRTFKDMDVDGLMAVTDYVDDESPLFIATDEQMCITGFYDEPHKDTRFISGGIYCLTDKSFATLKRCVGEGQSRMRNFQRQMVCDGLKLQAYQFSKIVDVDHAADIKKAEDFLR